MKELLDNVEREYIKTILKPFHNKVGFVVKFNSVFNKKEYLFISIKGGGSFMFPDFDAGKMYSGMVIDKKYTLEELGITYNEDTYTERRKRKK